MMILGISNFYNDSAAALLKGGSIVAASQEERFTRKKHDAGFPAHAIKSCLQIADIGLDDVDYIVFYDKPLLKLERLFETYLAFAPKGFRSFVTAMPIWPTEKLFPKNTIRKELRKLSGLNKKSLITKSNNDVIELRSIFDTNDDIYIDEVHFNIIGNRILGYEIASIVRRVTR